MLTTHRVESLVGPLHNALRTNINPRTGRHLPVHHQPLPFQFIKMFPVGPIRHQHGIRNQNPGCVHMGWKNRHRLSALDEQGFVIVQIHQRPLNLIKGLTVAGRFAPSSVNNQIIGSLRHIGIQIV